MSAPNDFRFTSSNKEKVALLINKKQGENYHEAGKNKAHWVQRHRHYSCACARSLHIEGVLSEAQRHNVRERNQLTDYNQIELSPFCCHCWGGEGEGEKDVSRVCAVGTEAQLASVCVCICVCLKEEYIDYYQDRGATLLLQCRVVCVCVYV